MKYLRRQIDNELLEWKNDSDRKPLLIRGARQVGKSSSVRHFGESFKYYLEINLESRKDLLSVFSEVKNVRELAEMLGILTGVPVIGGDTLLFIDEIQYSPDAIRLLRFFKEDYPELHVIAAGSLLEFAISDLTSFGVGRIRSLFMYPLSFKEFLWGMGKDGWLEAIRSATLEKPLFEALHNDLVRTYRTFLLVGGMPACVAEWINSQSYQKCIKLQEDIQQSYFDDFAKYSSKANVALLRSTLGSIVAQSGRKFVYSKVVSDARQSEIKEALNMLSMAGLIKEVKMSAANGLPLGAEINPKFSKYIYFDTGLMLRIQDLDLGGAQEMTEMIVAGAATELINKGGIAEMFVGWEMVKAANSKMVPELYYWENIAKGATAEVDYLTAYNMSVLPVEVKSGQSGKMKSLRTFMEKKKIERGVRTSLENFGKIIQDGREIAIIPLYAIYDFRKFL